MTDAQADDAPLTADPPDPQPPAASPPLTSIELVAEVVAEIHAKEPELAIKLRDSLRCCSLNELTRLFGSTRIIDGLLSGSLATLPLEFLTGRRPTHRQ